jgi:hypothetical protein
MANLFNDAMKTVVAGVVGGAITLIGSTYSYWNKDRELDIRMVDVALTILSAKDTNTKSLHAKRYAFDPGKKVGGS